MKSKNDMFVKIPKGKDVEFIDKYKNYLFLKLKKANKNRKEVKQK